MCVGFLPHARDRAPLPSATQLFGRGPGTAAMLVARCIRPWHGASSAPAGCHGMLVILAAPLGSGLFGPTSAVSLLVRRRVRGPRMPRRACASGGGRDPEA